MPALNLSDFILSQLEKFQVSGEAISSKSMNFLPRRKSIMSSPLESLADLHQITQAACHN